MSGAREAIRRRLERALAPLELEVRDEAAAHRGHAHEGAGHYSLRIVSPAFSGRTRIERHRLIYASLESLLNHGVHALRIQALAPEETR